MCINQIPIILFFGSNNYLCARISGLREILSGIFDVDIIIQVSIVVPGNWEDRYVYIEE